MATTRGNRSGGPAADHSGWWRALIPVVAAVALCWLFWSPLWRGEGFVGGDLYPYYFPQKQFLADSLRQRTLPLWNPLTGLGYPVLGESQTGACYPLNLTAYALFDVQTAWNLVHIVHYIAAFLAMWLFARRTGLESWGALLAAMVYVYGWFPTRAGLEWAILGGVYLPLALWCVEGFLQTQRPAYLVGLGAALGLQLLGGHYQIAFYTWLLLAVYVLVRSRLSEAQGWQSLGLLGAALVGGILLGGVQLIPTWELKQRSQRTNAGSEHDPSSGYIPSQYLSQLVAPWYWYERPDLDGELKRLRWAAPNSDTNRVEAHLYVGQAPFYLAVGGALVMLARRRLDRWTVRWWLIALGAIVVAVGWCQPVFAHLPGFSYFRGVGRISILVTLALALLSGQALDQLLGATPQMMRQLLGAGLLTITVVDLAWWPALINYSVIVPHPPIRNRDASPLRKLLLSEPQQPVRLYAPGANIANLLGVASTPVYLGLGPREYFDPRFTIPPAENNDFHAYTLEREAWLRQAGVTHILSFEPLAARGWPAVELIWQGFDPLLNPAWARFHEPLYLYRLQDAWGRAYWRDEAAEPRPRGSEIDIAEFTAHRVTAKAITPEARRLVLTELAYPGWSVTVDGQPAANLSTGMFRAVELPAGSHTVVWSYRPASVYWGLLVSALGAVWLGVVAQFARSQV